jgi:hypothetical protein
MMKRLRQLDAKCFNRACAKAGLLFLLLGVGAKYVTYARRGLPQTQDFSQYYMGGMMALHGEWDSLYPIPRRGALTNAGTGDASDLRERYRRRALAAGVDADSYRFIQPPPCALLFVPLAMMPFKTAHIVWTLLLIAAAVGVAVQASRVLELSLSRATKWGGVLILLICLSPQAFRWVRVGNVSLIVAWLIGYTTIELVRRDGARGAAALVAGAIIKYALLVLLPLVAAARRWRTLAWSVVLALAVLLVSLTVMGAAPFKTFAFEIAPTLGRTSMIGENQALYRFLLDVQGVTREDAMPRPLEIAFRVTQFACLGLMLALIAIKPPEHWETPSHVFAAALALIAWLLIFSPIFWEHYHAYLAPFWGWLAYEAMRSTVKRVAAIAAIALAYLPSFILLRQLHMTKLPQPLFSHLLWSAVIMWGMAVWDLIRSTDFQPVPAVQDETSGTG